MAEARDDRCGLRTGQSAYRRLSPIRHCDPAEQRGAGERGLRHMRCSAPAKQSPCRSMRLLPLRCAQGRNDVVPVNQLGNCSKCSPENLAEFGRSGHTRAGGCPVWATLDSRLRGNDRSRRTYWIVLRQRNNREARRHRNDFLARCPCACPCPQPTGLRWAAWRSRKTIEPTLDRSAPGKR